MTNLPLSNQKFCRTFLESKFCVRSRVKLAHRLNCEVYQVSLFRYEHLEHSLTHLDQEITISIKGSC